MALLSRMIFTWILSLLFLILTGVRLDGQMHWNWLLILVPVWVFDALLLIHISLLSVKDITRAFRGLEPVSVRIRGVLFRCYQMTLAFLKIAHLIMLAINLDYSSDATPKISWYVVFAPLVLILTCLSANTFVILLR